jgi:thiamine transport system substrate-binding protein
MVELAAKVAKTDVPNLANAFMAFILTERFQNLIPEGNWSLPSALPKNKWPEGFQELSMPENVLFYSEEDAANLRKEAIEEWRRALSQ